MTDGFNLADDEELKPRKRERLYLDELSGVRFSVYREPGCPPPETLWKFVDDSLPEGVDFDRIHVENCEYCLENLEELTKYNAPVAIYGMIAETIRNDTPFPPYEKYYPGMDGEEERRDLEREGGEKPS